MVNLLLLNSLRKILFSNLKCRREMSQLPKVYVKHIDCDEKIKIYFNFGLPESAERTYTFMRPKEEEVGVTLSRMKLKICEAVSNKLSNRKKKKVSENKDTNCEVILNLSLFHENAQVSNEVKNVCAWTENTTLKINDCVYEVLKNPPSVLHISLPKNIMAGFAVYPKIELEYCSRDQCHFSWYKNLTKKDRATLDLDESQILKLHNEYWFLLSNEYFYVTRNSDVGYKLRLSCVPKCDNKEGLEEVTVALKPVEEGPQKCPFEERHEFTKECTPPKRIRCISYNILADLYADSDTARNELFPYCPNEALLLDYRRQLYLKEIIGYNGDIICLQEVDRKVFNGDLVPVLTSTGLEGIYSEKGGQVVEGLSCFYRSSKFKLIESQAVILSDIVQIDPILKPIYGKLKENEALEKRFMSRTTALQVVLLESLHDPCKRLLVGNTHLFFHPDSDNIRLMQGTCCIWYMENALRKLQNEDSTIVTSMILCGDFNSCPEFGVYHLMTKGFVEKDCIDWKSNPDEIVSGIELRQSLQLGSACGTPSYTNYTHAFNGCLDYIFYDTTSLEVKEIVPFPKHDDVIKHTALPSIVFPSDHIALVSTLEWK